MLEKPYCLVVETTDRDSLPNAGYQCPDPERTIFGFKQVYFSPFPKDDHIHAQIDEQYNAGIYAIARPFPPTPICAIAPEHILVLYVLEGFPSQVAEHLRNHGWEHIKQNAIQTHTFHSRSFMQAA